MMRMLSLRWPSLASLAVASVLAIHPVLRPPVEPRMLGGLAWRNIGPFRGGRVSAVSGAVGQPGVFYAGYPAGGVWKTTSAGETWYPVFDSVTSVSSIGSLEVAPSDPNVIYVGTGDMVTGGVINEGNGVYRSSDAGKSWRHIGLAATKQIPSILVDPRYSTLVLVAAQGDLHKKSADRGVYRSTDGGRSWTKTLFVDDETGIQKLARANDVPNVIFAMTVRHYVPPVSAQTPPTPARPQADTGRTGTAMYKSIDEGLTWHEVAGTGLPRLAGRTSIAVAMNTNAQRVFLITNNGLYRSDNGGTSWRQMAAGDERIRNGQGGYSSGVYVDPKDPDVLYTLATATYKSTDGGNTFTGFKGAPGGDDPQQMWIDPTNGDRVFLGYDQGATISLDAGATWSTWYNQSTEQVYHISADNSYPYWVYATQQDAGAIRQRSRGNYGAVTMFDWNSVNGWEWGTIIADPLDPNTVFASGSGIVKIFYPSEQWINTSPAVDPAAKARTTSSQPMVWAPWNQRELVAGLNYVVTTSDGGAKWTRMSPELGIPKGMDSATAANTPGGRGAIESISASSVGKGTIWVGTNNGLVHVTRDGGRTWADVSIPDIPNARRANVSGIEASHHEAGTAYVAIEYARIGDFTPYLYRTRDFGKTWTKIVSGLPTDEPSGSVTRVIRADTKKAGLLFAGTESGMHVSFDDGDHWQSLSLNLPNTSYRDITIKGNDLIVGTYGRGIWILDDFSMLRQLTPAVALEAAHLFAPGDAIRTRRNVNADTPLPPEIPHALNPPDGAIIYYALSARPTADVTLDVLDAAGKVVRHMSSVAPAPVAEAARPPHPNFWLATPAGLPTNVGTNRVNWDLRYDAPPAFTHSFEINANPGLTPTSPEGPFALPGVYTLKLTAEGKSYTQALTIRNDPRSPASAAALAAQNALLMKLRDGATMAWDGYQAAVTLGATVAKSAGTDSAGDLKAATAAVRALLDTLAGPEGGRRFGGGAGAAPPPNFRGVNGSFIGQLTAQENADMAPTPSALAAYASTCKDLGSVGARWTRIIAHDVPALNTALSRSGKAPVAVPAVMVIPRGC